MSCDNDSYEVLVKPDDNVNTWYWEKINTNPSNYVVENNRKILRSKQGYICVSELNKGIGKIVNDIMRMYQKEFDTRFPGKISILPCDYWVMDKSDAHACRAYVVVDMP